MLELTECTLLEELETLSGHPLIPPYTKIYTCAELGQRYPYNKDNCETVSKTLWEIISNPTDFLRSLKSAHLCLLEVGTFPRKPERKYHWFEIQPLRILMKVRNLRHFVKLHFNISNSFVNPKMKRQIRCEKHMDNAKGKARWISTKCEGCFQHLSCLTHITRKAFYSNLNGARRPTVSSRAPSFWPLFPHARSTHSGAEKFILGNPSDIRHYWH